MANPLRYRCAVCRKTITATAGGKYRKHTDDRTGDDCAASGTFVPAHIVRAGPDDGDDAPKKGRDYATCPECGRIPMLDKEGQFYPHARAHGETEQCAMSGKAYEPATAEQKEEGEWPATDAPTEENAPMPPEPRPLRLPSLGLTTTSPNSAERASAAPSPTMEPAPESAPAAPDFARPGSPFAQPSRLPTAVTKSEPMSPWGEQIAARLKEIFHSYANRMERSVQTALGPSQIGTPCDRRIAMSLLRVPPVNPGGDNWASFVGTCVHAGLAEMFQWADAGSGRFAVETKLKFPSTVMPRGTADLLDRVLFMVDDHKLMGRWSLDKLRTRGPTRLYRTQVHTYGYGAQLRGERVEHVAIIAWPRQGDSLNDLYVWTEPYDPSIAIEALARVDRIAGECVPANGSAMPQEEALLRAKAFPVADDCRFCPFHAPGDKRMERGCDGRA